jgi:hypothetical protein
MSLSIAFGILVIETALTALVMWRLSKPGLRARHFVRMFGVYAGLTFLWAFGLAGTDEVREFSGISPDTIIALLLFALNAAVFVTAHGARERLQYGSAPTSQ